MKILISLITFNPNEELFLNHLKNLLNFEVDILIFDNASNKIEKIKKYVQNNLNVFLLISNKNLGVAAALNKVFNYANRNSYDWVLTLDQDSTVNPELIRTYLKYTTLPNVGILTCNIIDSTYGVPINKYASKVTKVDYCITSGSFCSVKAYTETSGFDDWLFIDCVDFDYCLKLKYCGFFTYCIPFDGLQHKVGETRYKKLFYKTIPILNEKPFRHFYIARNTYYLTYKYPKDFPPFIYIIREFKDRLKILLFEKDKILKIKNRIKGIKDAKKKIKEIKNS